MNKCAICGAGALSWEHRTVEQCEDLKVGSCPNPPDHHNFVASAISIPPMTIAEALKVGEACASDVYPPTNIAVLTRAAFTLYLANGQAVAPDQRKLIANILEWAVEVFRRNG